MDQAVEGITSVAPILKLAERRGVVMPIVSQVHMVLEGQMRPKDLGPHLATEDGIPQPELALRDASAPGFWKRLLRVFKGGSR